MSPARAVMWAGVLGLIGAIGPASTAAAQVEEQCTQWDRYGTCVKTVPLPVGDEPATPVGSGGSEPSGPAAPPPDCRWRSTPVVPGIEGVIGEPPPGMANPVLQYYTCDDLSHVPDSALGLPIGFRWVDGTGPVAPPSPEALVAILYARVQAVMVAPVVVSDPPAASPAIVRLPVFVDVSNWQGEIVDTESVPGLGVTMTASPSLVFKPGEPGAGEVACVGSGTRFDPGGPPAIEQARAPGACAWAYSLRSGAAGRPGEWPSEVTVNWAVRWEATNGDTGVMPGLSFTTPVPRLVNEVQTVVVDDE